MCRRANCFLFTFYATTPAIKTLLFRTFYLSLYGSALWRLSSSNLRSLEVTFNNLLRKIWKLPRHCHTSILHCISSLQSLYNVICCYCHTHLMDFMKYAPNPQHVHMVLWICVVLEVVGKKLRSCCMILVFLCLPPQHQT